MIVFDQFLLIIRREIFHGTDRLAAEMTGMNIVLPNFRSRDRELNRATVDRSLRILHSWLELKDGRINEGPACMC